MRNDLQRLGTTEIAKRIRQQLKDEFKSCKFSVTSKHFSMGSSIDVTLMKADRKIKLDFDKIPEKILSRYTDRQYSPYGVEELKTIQGRNYHQLSENAFYHYQKYDDHWNNGAFLTYQGYMFLKRVCQIVETYHYEDSDIQTDYYNTNFYFHLGLGKYDRPFEDGTGFVVDPDLMRRIEDRDSEIKVSVEKAQKTKEEKDALDRLESESHMAKDKKLREKVRSIMQSHAIIDGNGFNDIRTVEAKIKKLAEIDDLRQIFKVKGIDWSKELLEL